MPHVAAGPVHFDVFRADADGICALQQLRLARPHAAVIVGGRRDEAGLLDKVRPRRGDTATVLGLPLEGSGAAVQHLLDAGVAVSWFDHRPPARPLRHPLLRATLDPAPGACTSAIVDAWLSGRFRAWAAVGAFGAGLDDTGRTLAKSAGCGSDEDVRRLRQLAQALDYDANGECEADVLVRPPTLVAGMRGHEDPLAFLRDADLPRLLAAHRTDDLRLARATSPHTSGRDGVVYVLPDGGWSRRVHGVFADELAQREPERAHVVMAPAVGALAVSVRAPHAWPFGAGDLCRRFGGSGDERAGRIARLHVPDLGAFVGAFLRAFDSEEQ